jgi:hypothetical protein
MKLCPDGSMAPDKSDISFATHTVDRPVKCFIILKSAFWKVRVSLGGKTVFVGMMKCRSASFRNTRFTKDAPPTYVLKIILLVTFRCNRPTLV